MVTPWGGTFVSLTVSALVLAAVASDAQTFRTTARRLEIQSASVQRSQEPRRERPGQRSFLAEDSIWQARSVTIPALIYDAYGIEPWKVTGLPDWAKSERFDLVVTFTDLTSLRQQDLRALSLSERAQVRREPVQIVLDELFQLRAGVRRVDATVHALVPIESRAQAAAALRPAEADCDAAVLEENPSSLDAEARERVLCGTRLTVGELKSGGVTMRILASELARQIGSWVVDDTQRAGHYEFQLRHHDVRPRGLWGPFVSDLPSLTEAVEEQLGLTLKRERRLVDALVVESVRRPRLER